MTSAPFALPQFDKLGFLPPGLHVADLDEVEHRFGWNPPRQKLMRALRWFHGLAEAAGMNRLVLAGSFVSNKPNPLDLDGVVLGNDDSAWDMLVASAEWAPNGGEKPIANYEGARLDIFPARSPAEFRMTTSMFAHVHPKWAGHDAESKRPRGLIDLLLQPRPRFAPIYISPDVEALMIELRIEKVRAMLQQHPGAFEQDELASLLKKLEKEREAKSSACFFRQCLEAEVSMPSSAGTGDVQINTVLGSILAHTGPLRVIDSGCAQGRLISELVTLDPSVLGEMDYVGLDFDVAPARMAAAKYGLDRAARSVHFATFEAASAFQETGDFVFSVNVLHEVRLREIGGYLRNLLLLAAQDGVVLLHDMEHLAFGERGFVPWTGDELRTVINNCGLTATARRHKSKGGVPLFTVAVRRPIDGTIPTESQLRKQAVLSFAAREERLVKRRATQAGNIDEREYAYLSVVIANLREQMTEVSDLPTSADHQ